MKHANGLLIAFVLLTLLSCKKEPPPFVNNLIPVNNCRSFMVSEKTIQICLDSVTNDSRCPDNAVCIWEGLATARFSANFQNGENHIFTLSTNKLMGNDKVIELEGVRIELVNITPHPGLNRQFNYRDYLVEVKVTQP